MLQEMKLEDALKKFLKGRKVLVLYNEVTSTDKPVYGEPLKRNAGRNAVSGGCACNRGFGA